ncbi:MAG: diguanylate cyclase [Acidobacteriota bacterium]
MKILVADDDRVSRRLLENTLTRLKHEVISVGDGPSALASLLGPDGPRLAILDWMMPGADGIEVCRQARAKTERYVYIILLTARDRREDLVTAFDAEIDDFLTKPLDIVELRARLRSGERVLGLQERLLATQEALRREATHDRLTGIWNRGMILDELGKAVERARREHTPMAVLMADIDRFKDVNDRHGHSAGDQVLQAVTTRMRGALRRYDDIGRYGGEEFLIVVQGCDAALAHQLAERMRTAVAEQPVVIGDGALSASVSVGVAWTNAAPASPDDLVNAADAALYRAKRAGRNRVEDAVA